MKIITLIALLGYITSVSSQFLTKQTLETREKTAIFISNKQLNYSTSIPKIIGLNKNEWFESYQVINGGLGFFEQGDETGVNINGAEQVTVKDNQLTTVKPNETIEILNILANNAYCGAL